MAAAFQFGAAIQFAPAEGWLAYTTPVSASSTQVNIEIAGFGKNGELLPVRELGPYGGIGDLAWSPSGDQFVFSDSRNIYLADVPRGLIVNLTEASQLPVSARVPIWSPTGDRIAYLYYTQDQTTLRIYDLNSSSTRLIPAPMVTPIVVWSPDGKTILLVTQVITNNSGFTTDIMRMSLDSGQLVDLTNNYANNTNPAFAPDGKKIAFMSDRTGSFQIYAMDADGKNAVQLTHGSAISEFPEWLSDHQIIYYSYDSSAVSIKAEIVDLATQQVQPMVTTDPLVNFALSRDASRIAVVFKSDHSPFKLCLFSSQESWANCPNMNSLPYLTQFVWGH